MSFIVLLRDEHGAISYLNKEFSTEEEAFTFCKSHSITEYMILTLEEFQAWLSNKNQSSSSGYHQSVEAISDERTGSYDIPRHYSMTYKNFRPAFVRPAFVGRRIRR